MGAVEGSAPPSPTTRSVLEVPLQHSAIEPTERGFLVTFGPRHSDGDPDRQRERQQKVRVREYNEGGTFLESRALGSSAVDAMSWGDLANLVWLRNERLPLVGYLLDGRERLVGRLALPRRNVRRDELTRLVMMVARESDRLELVRTGRDRF